MPALTEASPVGFRADRAAASSRRRTSAAIGRVTAGAGPAPRGRAPRRSPGRRRASARSEAPETRPPKESTTSCRSTNSLTRTARTSASSGRRSDVGRAGAAARAGRGWGAPKIRPLAGAVTTDQERPASRARLSRWNSSASTLGAVGLLQQQRAWGLGQRRQVGRRERRVERPAGARSCGPDRARGGFCRRRFGPSSSSTRSGQFGQFSNVSQARAFDGETRKPRGRTAARPEKSSVKLTRERFQRSLTAFGGVIAARLAERRDTAGSTGNCGARNASALRPRRKSGRRATVREAEERAEGEQRQHQPDRMQADRFADQFRREDVALEKLAGDDDAQHDESSTPVRPALHQSDATDSTRQVSEPT